MIDLEELDTEDFETLKFYINRHHAYTNSTIAKNILDNWDVTSKYFVKVMPTDYKNVLIARKANAESINA
ncbi:MAG: hypothetical protein R2807_08835 [Chitinophagales bacterium]